MGVSVSVCLYVGLSVRELISGTTHAPKPHRIFCIYCLWPWLGLSPAALVEVMYTSDFVDVVIFSYYGPSGGVACHYCSSVTATSRTD